MDTHINHWIHHLLSLSKTALQPTQVLLLVVNAANLPNDEVLTVLDRV